MPVSSARSFLLAILSIQGAQTHRGGPRHKHFFRFDDLMNLRFRANGPASKLAPAVSHRISDFDFGDCRRLNFGLPVGSQKADSITFHISKAGVPQGSNRYRLDAPWPPK